MRKILLIIGMCLLLLLTGCNPYPNVVEVGDFKCRMDYNRCNILAEKYMVYKTLQGYNITEMFSEIQRLSEDS